MASRKRNLICVLFDKVPKGTHYRKGAYSWVNKPEGLEYIEEGYGEEYDPAKAQTKEPEPEQPEDSFPKDFPDTIKRILKEAGKDWEDTQKLHDKEKLQSVPGIGKSTEHKINQYLEAN